eukprot:8105415-Karenia_brevis.AAC.1
MPDDSDDDMAGQSDPPIREWSAARGRRLVARTGQSEDDCRRAAQKADALFRRYTSETRPYQFDIENIDRDAMSWLIISKAQSR